MGGGERNREGEKGGEVEGIRTDNHEVRRGEKWREKRESEIKGNID
ncbi:hypothetical protein [Escherichia coli]|nr:hypothetical protein [Escherichia coli]